jgi:steroid 5-alpha reductase family enzyme
MNPAVWTLLLGGWLGAAVLMTVLWLVQRRTGNAAIVDVGWAASLGLMGVIYGLCGPGNGLTRTAVAVITGLWGVRLAWHLLRDRVLGQPEEGRYLELRRSWQERFQPKLFGFYQAQALLAAVLSLPFALAVTRPEPNWLDLVAVALWVFGLMWEATADRQLARFKQDPANLGRVCRDGLWRYSRHPNYFGEWLIWLAFALPALPAPAGWLGLLSPALMLLFILKITGIPPTEAQALRSRGEEYRRYQRTTSAFVPWRPREESP